MPGRLLSIGECMVELSQAGEGLLRKGFAGDTFNTAWYARACLPVDWNVDYFTALGDDPMSSEMLTFMETAGIGTESIRRIPGRTPGLYLITLNNGGERTFSYWRDTAAARSLADDADHLRQSIESADIVYFSGITLGILTPEANDTLLSELRRAKAAGKRVAFDPNVRPRLWTDRDTMLKTISDGARAATLVLPSFDDETTHFGDRTVDDTINRYHGLGVEGVVVKNGEHGVTLSFGGATSYVPAVQAPEVVDTTSAGDSFNGGFLSRLVRGAAPDDAARYGAAVASIVIRHHGALINPALLPG